MPSVKAILGYDRAKGVSAEDYESWLWDIHYPDLLENPFLDKIELNTIVRPINETSAGTPIMDVPVTFFRIAELHFADHAAYEKYLEWFRDNPIPVERSPEGRSDFRFYVLADVVEATRE